MNCNKEPCITIIIIIAFYSEALLLTQSVTFDPEEPKQNFRHYTKYPTKDHYSNIRIQNLNEFLNPFKDCLINLINYQGIDFKPFAQPVVLSRYIHVEYSHYYAEENYTDTGDVLMHYEKLPSESNTDYRKWYRHQKEHFFVYSQREDNIWKKSKFIWTCTTHFFLYPPDPPKDYNTSKYWESMRIPTLFQNFWVSDLPEESKRSGSFQGFPKESFHILVTAEGRRDSDLASSVSPENDSTRIWKYWNNGMGDLLFTNMHKGNLMHLLTNMKFPQEPEIQTMFFVCQYCETFRRIRVSSLELLGKSTLKDRSDIDSAFHQVNTMNNGVPYEILPDFWPGLNETAREPDWCLTGTFAFKEHRPLENLIYNGIVGIGENESGTFPLELVMLREMGGALFGKNATYRIDHPLLKEYSCARDDILETCNIPGNERFCGVTTYTTPSVTLLWIKNIAITSFEKSFTFLTCHVKLPDINSISFKGFFSAFDSDTWIWTSVLFYLGPSILLNLIFYFKYDKKHLLNPDLLFMGYKVLLEQGDVNVCNPTKRNYIYWICAPMLMMAVVISNAYKGENITELASPIMPIPYLTFDQLIEDGFDIFSPAVEDMINKDESTAWMIISPIVPLFPYKKKYITVLEQSVALTHSYQGTQKEYEVLKSHIKLHDLAAAILEKNTSVEYTDILKECNKTAIADFNSKLLELANKLSSDSGHRDDNPRKRYRLQMGTENLFVEKRGLAIERSLDPRVPIRLGMLIQCGIVLKWDKLIKGKFEFVNRYTSEFLSQFKPLQLYGNVLAQFLILGSGLGLSTLVFWIEKLELTISSITNFNALIVSYFKMLSERIVLGSFLVLFRIGHWIHYRGTAWGGVKKSK